MENVLISSKPISSGDTLWTRAYGGPGEDEGNAVQQTTDGGYIVAGTTTSFGAGGWDVYLIKDKCLGRHALDQNLRRGV